MRLLVFSITACFVIMAAAAEPLLPKMGERDSFDIEPPLLIQNGRASAPVELTDSNPERLQLLLNRVKQSAASAERQFRAGIIARVQVDERVVKVARLEADLAAAQLRVARQAEPATAAVSSAEEAARASVARREAAERLFAETNLQRQRKLLALGSGRKADVERAAEKLAALAYEKKN